MCYSQTLRINQEFLFRNRPRCHDCGYSDRIKNITMIYAGHDNNMDADLFLYKEPVKCNGCGMLISKVYIGCSGYSEFLEEDNFNKQEENHVDYSEEILEQFYRRRELVLITTDKEEFYEE